MGHFLWDGPYVAIVGPKSVFPGADTTQLEDNTDDLSETILFADVNQHTVHWMSPVDISPEELLEEIAKTADEANHTGGLYVVNADESIRTLSADTPTETIKAMTTIAADD
jgi:hypothetical protein